MATNAEIITQLYVGYYDRAPDPEGLNYWIGRIEAGVSLADIANSFATSPEAIATYPFFSFPELVSAETFLKSVYLNLFGRAIDADGLAYYSEQLSSGATPVGQILAQIIGNAATNEGSADQKFLANKVAVGVDWATTAASTQGFVFNDSAKNSAASILDAVNATDASVTAAKAATVEYFNSPKVTLSLTTGTDNIQGTVANELIRADHTTLQATDIIDGGAGTDTFEYTDAGTVGGNIPAAQVKNVEIINIRNINGTAATTATKETVTLTFNDVTGGATTGATVDVGGSSTTTALSATLTGAELATYFSTNLPAGYEFVSLNGSQLVLRATTAGNVADLAANYTPGTGAGAAGTAPSVSISQGVDAVASTGVTDTVTAGNFVGATEFNSLNSTNDVVFSGVSGTQSVGIIGNGSTLNGNVSYTLAAAATATTINVKGGVKQGNITNTGASVATATINSSGAANTLGTIDLGTGTNVTKLTVNASSNLKATLAADYAAAGADLVVAGAATSVDLGTAGTFKTIDASGLAGGLTIQTSTVTSSVKGGAGNDVITLNGLTATATIDLGAGNDKLLGTVAPGAGVTIDGGAGTDTVASTLINAGNGANFKNFEVLDLGANTLDTALLTGSTLEKLSLSGASGGTFTNVKAGLGLEVSATAAAGGATTIGVKDAATNTADTFAITFAGAAVATAPVAANVLAGTIAVAEVETVSIVSAGGANTWNSIALTDNKLQTLTITGDKALDLTFVGVNGTNTAALAGGAVKLIDGSAATGKLSINTANVVADDKAGVGLTIKGGSAGDTITLAQKATVDAGAGNDKIVSAAAGGTFTGGAGNDTFDVKAAVGQVVTITDFTVGADKLTLKDQGTEVFTSAKIDVSAATDLTAALNLASTADGSVNAQVKWFQYGGDTYVVQDLSAGATFDTAHDIAVKLTGTLDLSTLTVSGFDFA